MRSLGFRVIGIWGSWDLALLFLRGPSSEMAPAELVPGLWDTGLWLPSGAAAQPELQPWLSQTLWSPAPEIPAFLASLQPTWQIKGQPRAWKPRSQDCECQREPQLRAPRFPLQGISQVWLPLQPPTTPQLCKAPALPQWKSAQLTL